ncbi:hypothetical protein RJ639_046152, partial [Escallonia herrerae]
MFRYHISIFTVLYFFFLHLPLFTFAGNLPTPYSAVDDSLYDGHPPSAPKLQKHGLALDFGNPIANGERTVDSSINDGDGGHQAKHIHGDTRLGDASSRQSRIRPARLPFWKSGYMAPEYEMHGRYSMKSDVFSFGVLVLILVSGQGEELLQSSENAGDLLS